MSQDASISLRRRPAVLKPSSNQMTRTRRYQAASSKDENDLFGEEEADQEDYPDAPTTPPSLSTFDSNDPEGSSKHFRSIAEECGVPIHDIDLHVDHMCNILHGHEVYSGRGILSKISYIREILTEEP